MADLTGKILKGRYRVEEYIDRGGMAEVYRVTDLQRGITLAMKVLRADLAEDKVFLNRFQKEARNLAELQHPNIVRFYSLEQEGRLVFILLDFIEGSTLRAILADDDHPMKSDRILQILEPVCKALHYAHLEKRVHCDVKPSNIMVDNKNNVYLADFGIMRHMDTSTMTLEGIGTPAYMAPELIRNEKPTPQTDIYSLGIVLYEMLTGGKRPFIGEKATISGTTGEKVRWEQLRLQPPPPSKYNKKISNELDQFVLKCLRKDPQARFVSMSEFINQLKGLLISEGKTRYEGVSVLTNALDKKNSIKVLKKEKPEELQFKEENKRIAPGKWLLLVGGVLLVVVVLSYFFLPKNLVVIKSQPSVTEIPNTPIAMNVPTTVINSKNEIKIAILAPLSGPVPAFGVSVQDGALMAIEEKNAKGGVLGMKIIPIVEDSQCTADIAINSANKVIEQDKVNYIMGEVCSGASIPVSEIAQEKHVVMVSPTSTNSNVTLKADGTAKEYVFRACFIDPFQAPAMAKFALSMGYKTAFIMLDPGNDYVHVLADAFEKAYTENGGKVIGKETYNANTTDFSTILNKVKASNAQVLWIPDYYNIVNLIAAQAKARGVTAVMMGGDGWDSADLDKKSTDGGYYSNHYTAYDSRTLVQDFIKRYQVKYNTVPDALGALAYDATNLIIAAIEKAGVDDASKVKDAMANLELEAVTGQIKFDKFHNPTKSVFVFQIKYGSVVYVTSIAPE